MKKRYTEKRIIGFLRKVYTGLPAKELCRNHGCSESSHCAGKVKLGGMTPYASTRDGLARRPWEGSLAHGKAERSPGVTASGRGPRRCGSSPCPGRLSKNFP